MPPRRKKPQDKQPEAPKRDAKGRLVPGQSGNPGGQPKWVKELRDALQQECAPLAVKTLHAVMLGQVECDVGDMLKAADITLSYVLPKPKQEVEVSTSEPSPFAGLTPVQLLAALKGKP